jgi:hypothetical protein
MRRRQQRAGTWAQCACLTYNTLLVHGPTGANANDVGVDRAGVLPPLLGLGEGSDDDESEDEDSADEDSNGAFIIAACMRLLSQRSYL